jgi:hypothetical protein
MVRLACSLEQGADDECHCVFHPVSRAFAVAVAPSDRLCFAGGAGTITLAIKTVEMDEKRQR